MNAVILKGIPKGDIDFKQVQAGENEMAFVNEYVPDEDIEKYKLNEIWLKKHPVEKFIPKHVQLHWTSIEFQKGGY